MRLRFRLPTLGIDVEAHVVAFGPNCPYQGKEVSGERPEIKHASYLCQSAAVISLGKISSLHYYLCYVNPAISEL